MKKRVLRLTEQDLHNIIKETVNKIIKESVFDNNNMDMLTSEINNIIDFEVNEVNNGEAILNGFGKDGSHYQIYVLYYVNEGQGVIPSNDYNVPDDYDADTIDIRSINITKWNEMNEEEEIPYKKNIMFEDEIKNELEDYLNSSGMINN